MQRGFLLFVRPLMVISQEIKLETYRSKLALITGGSSGIGLSIAKEILRQGGNVAILARRTELLSEAVSELEKNRINDEQLILSLPADVTKAAPLHEKLTKFVEKVGLPDIIINSAGVAHPGSFSSLTMDIFHWMMDVNYFGTVNVLKVLVPLMQKRKSGKIVNISSLAGLIGTYGYTAYGASKFAVNGFTEALRSELKPYGIQVSIVFPPDTETPQLEYESEFKPFITKTLTSTAKLSTSEEVAKDIVKNVGKGKYLIFPGSEGKMLFFERNILGGLQYPVMDMMIRSAIKKLKFKP
jgi:3-dehydrosphinganine reductase